MSSVENVWRYERGIGGEAVADRVDIMRSVVICEIGERVARMGDQASTHRIFVGNPAGKC